MSEFYRKMRKDMEMLVAEMRETKDKRIERLEAVLERWLPTQFMEEPPEELVEETRAVLKKPPLPPVRFIVCTNIPYGTVYAYNREQFERALTQTAGIELSELVVENADAT